MSSNIALCFLLIIISVTSMYIRTETYCTSFSTIYVSHIFHDVIFVRCSIDEIVIKSKSIEPHKDRVIQFMKTLNKNNMIINYKKS